MRVGRVMPTFLLASQCRDLKPFQADERRPRADSSGNLEKVMQAILANVTGR